jgi:signal transduction histidine kinase
LLLPVFRSRESRDDSFTDTFSTNQGFIMAVLDLGIVFQESVVRLKKDVFSDAKFEFWDITDPAAVILLLSNIDTEIKTSSQFFQYWQNKSGITVATKHFSAGGRDFLFSVIVPGFNLPGSLPADYLSTVSLIILFILFTVIFYLLTKKYRKNKGQLQKYIDDSKKAASRLKELQKAQDNFASTVSHELKTPLTAINTALQIVAREGIDGLNENQKNYFQKARNNTDCLSKLIASVLNVSKIESGKRKLNIRLVNVNHIISDVVDIEKFSAEKKGLSLIMELGDVLPEAEVDVEGIDQVLTTLIDNAIKFTDQGKIFIISKSNRERNYIEVIITDTGEGIAHADYLKVFDQFNQLQKPQDVKAGGGRPRACNLQTNCFFA